MSSTLHHLHSSLHFDNADPGSLAHSNYKPSSRYSPLNGWIGFKNCWMTGRLWSYCANYTTYTSMCSPNYGSCDYMMLLSIPIWSWSPLAPSPGQIVNFQIMNWNPCVAAAALRPSHLMASIPSLQEVVRRHGEFDESPVSAGSAN